MTASGRSFARTVVFYDIAIIPIATIICIIPIITADLIVTTITIFTIIIITIIVIIIITIIMLCFLMARFDGRREPDVQHVNDNNNSKYNDF